MKSKHLHNIRPIYSAIYILVFCLIYTVVTLAVVPAV